MKKIIKRTERIGKFNIAFVQFGKDYIEVADIGKEPAIKSFVGKESMQHRLFMIGARMLNYKQDKRAITGWTRIKKAQ